MATEVDVLTERFDCPRCGAFSHHVRSVLRMHVRVPQGTATRPFNDLRGTYSVTGTEVRSMGTSHEQWTATVCVSCTVPSVWRDSQLVYPRGSTVPGPHPDMPELARELYEEASAVLPDSRRAAAALARAALESFLKSREVSPSRKNLQSRIADLKDQVSHSLWQVLTALRVVGNDALHGEDDEIVRLYLSGDDADMAETFFGALNALVEELVTAPKRAADLYAKIPEAKRDAAERAR